MSWQAYIDTTLVGSGHVDKGAIFNAEGTSVWATSPGFVVSPIEIKEIVNAFKDTSEPKKIQMHGIHIAGTKYFVLKAEEGSIYGKEGKQGIIIVKTKQTLLVAHYPEAVQPGSAVNTVENLGSYLTKLGY